MSFLDKLFGRDLDDDHIYEYEGDYYEPQTDVMRQPEKVASSRPSRIVNFNPGNAAAGPKAHMVEIIEPKNMECMWQICDYVREGKTVICNIEAISAEHRQRLVDFVTGAAYAMEGEIQPVSQLIFVFTPRSTKINRDGRTIDSFESGYGDDYMRDARVFAR